MIWASYIAHNLGNYVLFLFFTGTRLNWILQPRELRWTFHSARHAGKPANWIARVRRWRVGVLRMGETGSFVSKFWGKWKEWKVIQWNILRSFRFDFETSDVHFFRNAGSACCQHLFEHNIQQKMAGDLGEYFLFIPFSITSWFSWNLTLFQATTWEDSIQFGLHIFQIGWWKNHQTSDISL